MLLALTRPVPPSIVGCELTHLARTPIDVRVASAQHERYEAALAALGCAVERLPAEPDLADSVFVEDAAVVLDELAVITRPGAESRRAETASVAATLLVNPRWIDLDHFAGIGAIAVHPDEPFAANALRVGRALLCSAAAPRTRELLEAEGFAVETVDVSELAKAEAGVTCCSLLVRV